MLQTAARFGHLGLFFGVAIVVGLLAGRWVDIRYHTGHTGQLVGIVVGMAAGVREFYRAFRALKRSEKNAARDAERTSGRGSA